MKSVQKWMLVVGLFAFSQSVLASENNKLQTATVKQERIPQLHYLDGHIEAVNQSTVSAQTSGVIESLSYDIDDVVKEGSVIAQIRAKNQEAGLQQARAGVSKAAAGTSQAKAVLGQAQAGLAEARAGLGQAQAGQQQAQADWKQAQAGLQEAQARLKEAQSEFKRISDIYQRRLIPRADYDRAEAGLASAHARVKSARSQTDSARARVESSRSMIEAARARVGSADSSLKAAQASLEASRANQSAASARVQQAGEQLGYTQLLVPYSGIVTQRHVELGEAVNPGTPIMTVISLEQMRVIVEVPQRLINLVRDNKTAQVFRDGTRELLPMESMTIFPYADFRTNAFRVRIQLKKGLKNIFPGMFVKVALVTGMEEVLVVPKSAVAVRSEVTGVYVINETGRPSLRQIRLGREVDSERVRVLAGLDAGEQVALDPAQAVLTLKKYTETMTVGTKHHE